jgi:hypothetical protein
MRSLLAGAPPVVAMLIETGGERIQSIFAIATSGKLAAIARAPRAVRP